MKVGLIPIYLEAPNKDELIKKMLLNNLMNGRKFNYMNPFKDGKKWNVWFYADIDNYQYPDGTKKVGVENELQ